MKTVKRVEIVTDSQEMLIILRLIERLGIGGYTLIQDVLGKGNRGIQRGDELTDVCKNCLLLIACEPEQVPPLVEALGPLLKKRGGICLVSDAEW